MATAARQKIRAAAVEREASRRQVILSAAVSLDGYIARPDGSVDWLIMDPNLNLSAFFKTIDIALMGRKTLDIAKSLGGGKSKSWSNSLVFSRALPPGKHDGAEFTNRPPSEIVRELRTKPGKNIWLMGGGELARDFLAEDLVDRIDLGVMPVLLGEGIPLFPSKFPQRRFALTESKSYPSGIVTLSYARAAK